MKIEIEITEDELRKAMRKKVNSAIVDVCDSYDTDLFIKKVVKENWQAVAEKAVIEALSKYDVIFDTAQKALEDKLKAQLANAMKIKRLS